MDSKQTWEKILEYATMPVNGSLSRKLRKGVKIQVNSGDVFESAVILLEESILWISEKENDVVSNTYFDWSKIASIRIISPEEKK